MTVEELKFLWEGLRTLGFGALVGAAVAFLLLKIFLPGYLAQKGKNLADKEDIAALTREIEAVKSEYSLIVEQFKANHQLRMAAVDKRLQAHQDAFKWWRRLMAEVYGPEIAEVVMDCQQWWVENCLYLEPEARDALSDAYSYALGHARLVEYGRGHPRGNTLTPGITESWRRIEGAGAVIVKAVQLPPLTERTMAMLTEVSAPTNAADPP